jgi:hypothetical protein
MTRTLTDASSAARSRLIFILKGKLIADENCCYNVVTEGISMATTKATVKSKHLNIRTTPAEYDAIKRLAQFRGTSISGLILNLLQEQLDDWEDMKAFKDYEAAKARGEVPLISWEQIQKDAGLLPAGSPKTTHIFQVASP